MTENPALAALIGCFLGGAFVWFIGSDWEDNLIRYGTYAIAAISTLFASFLAWQSATRSINHQLQQSAEDRFRELNAARALLPATLSEIHSLAEFGFQSCLNMKSVRKDPEKANRIISRLKLSDQMMKNLQDCIRQSDGAAKEWLILIPSYWQIATERLDSNLFTDGLLILDGQPEHASLDWLILKAIVLHLFDFARTGQEPVEELDQLHFTANFSTICRFDPVFHEAKDKYSEYVSKHGGWTISGFQSRLVRENHST